MNLHEGSQPKTKIGLLDDDTLNYYRRVFETLQHEFQNDEEKDLFFHNALGQLSQEALKVSQNQTGSRIAEALIKEGQISDVHKVFVALSKDWKTATTDRFASHVLQTLVSVVSKHWSASENPLEKVFSSLYDYISENLESLVTDTYGSHIVRGLLETLGGVTVSNHVIRSQVSRKNNESELKVSRNTKLVVSEDLTSKLKKLVKNIFKICDYEDHLIDINFNPVVQTVLLVVHLVDSEMCIKLCKNIIKKGNLQLGTYELDDKVKLPALIQDKIGSYLVEQIIAVSDSDQLENIFISVFKSRILFYATDKIANYVLQKLISSVSDKKLFMDVFDELSPFVEDTMAFNHLGVITELAKACVRFHTRQKKLIKVLMECFHCAEPEERCSEFVKLLASLTTYDVFFEQGMESTTDVNRKLLTNINFHGSLLLQQLLQFNNPKLVVSSLLHLQHIELKTLSCDQCGSHVIDTFFQSQSVGEKNFSLMIDKLKGCFLEMACSRNGSRTIEAIWKCISLKQKCLIAEELSQEEDKLRSDQFGRFIHRNFAISHFKHRRSDWQGLQGVASKKRKMFKDIIDEKDGPVSKHKKSANKSTDSKENLVECIDSQLEETENEKSKWTALEGSKKKHNHLLFGKHAKKKADKSSSNKYKQK